MKLTIFALLFLATIILIALFPHVAFTLFGTEAALATRFLVRGRKAAFKVGSMLRPSRTVGDRS